MENPDIRWKQRFQNFEKAYKRLNHAIEVVKKEPDNEVLTAGLIQTYEFTFELAWKTLKDYLEMEGFNVPSPRSTIRQAYQSGYIQNAEDWMQALNDRNLTTHTYDDQIAMKVINDINRKYFPFLKQLHLCLHHIYEEENVDYATIRKD